MSVSYSLVLSMVLGRHRVLSRDSCRGNWQVLESKHPQGASTEVSGLGESVCVIDPVRLSFFSSLGL